MLIIKKIILIALILIGKLIALPMLVLIQGILLLTDSCGRVAKLIMGFFNFIMGIMFFYFLATHNMDMLKTELYLYIAEAIGVTLVILAKGVLDLIAEFFKQLLFFSPFAKSEG